MSAPAPGRAYAPGGPASASISKEKAPQALGGGQDFTKASSRNRRDKGATTDGTTVQKGAGPDDKDEQAGDNTTTENLEHLDPLDKGATQLKDKGHWQAENDNSEDTGPSPEMRFPLLDIEPNTITSTNGELFEVNLLKRAPKPTIDFESLAYESVVGNMQGLKKAFNSKKYGSLAPDVAVKFKPHGSKRKVWMIDSEALQDSISEAAFGYHTTNTQLADDLKRSMRSFVQPNSHYHGGPTMFKRGLNQYRNKAIRGETLDPAADKVDVATQNARDAFVLNDQVLYGNDNTKLQFRTRENATRQIPDSSNTGHLPEPTDGRYQSNFDSASPFGYPGLANERQMRFQNAAQTPGGRADNIGSTQQTYPGVGLYSVNMSNGNMSAVRNRGSFPTGQDSWASAPVAGVAFPAAPAAV